MPQQALASSKACCRAQAGAVCLPTLLAVSGSMLCTRCSCWVQSLSMCTAAMLAPKAAQAPSPRATTLIFAVGSPYLNCPSATPCCFADRGSLRPHLQQPAIGAPVWRPACLGECAALHPCQLLCGWGLRAWVPAACWLHAVARQQLACRLPGVRSLACEHCPNTPHR